MSTVDPTSSAATAAASGTSGSTVSRTDNSLGQNQFLQLMMDQLKAQDPLNPSDPTQFLSELASFSSLEQETSISSSASSTASQQSAGTAVQLLGKTVDYTDTNGQTQTGTVSKVDLTSSGPQLTIGSASGIALSSVTEVS